MSEGSELDLNTVTDVDKLRDFVRDLQEDNENLKRIISEERTRNQTIEFKQRESQAQIQSLREQKRAIQRQLEQTAVRNAVLKDRTGNTTEIIQKTHNYYDSDEESDNGDRDEVDEVSRLKSEIEDLQLALAEERMLGMQLDYSSRQSSQRADSLQYQLAEEKLKNMHLLTTHEKLKLELENDSTTHANIPTNNNNNNRSNNNTNNSYINDQSRESDDNSASPLSKGNNDFDKEFDLRIDDEPEEQIDPASEVKRLQQQLISEQFEKVELKHQHRKSEMKLQGLEEEFKKLQDKYSTDQNYLDPASALLIESMKNEDALNSGNTPGGSSNDSNNNNQTNINNTHDRANYEAKIADLEEQLNDSKKKQKMVDKERRNSLNIMSKNFFVKQLNAAQDNNEMQEQLKTELEKWKVHCNEVMQSKFKFIDSANETIDQLRSHIVELSTRLRKYEKWDNKSTLNNVSKNTVKSSNNNDITDL